MRVIQPPKNAKQVYAFLDLMHNYQKFIKNFAHIAKSLTTLMCHDTKFNWTLTHQAAFINLTGALTQVPVCYYPDPSKLYIVYKDTSDDACEFNYHRNITVRKYQMHSSHIHSQTLNTNGAPPNKKPMGYIMP